MVEKPFVVKDGVLDQSQMKEDKRVTLVLTAALDLNLEIYAMTSGCLKKDVVAEALTLFLKTQGIPDPMLAPRIEWNK